MADRQAAPQTQSAVVVCIRPDICRSPDDPVPYQIVALHSDLVGVSENVLVTGFRGATEVCVTPNCYNDEAGTGGGVRSGTQLAQCRPTQDWSSTVRINGNGTLRHDTEFEMNNGNTSGKTVYPAEGTATFDGNPRVVLSEKEREFKYGKISVKASLDYKGRLIWEQYIGTPLSPAFGGNILIDPLTQDVLGWGMGVKRGAFELLFGQEYGPVQPDGTYMSYPYISFGLTKAIGKWLALPVKPRIWLPPGKIDPKAMDEAFCDDEHLCPRLYEKGNDGVTVNRP